MLGDLAVVFEGLGAGGLLVGAGEGHVADLEQLRGGEEGHVRGVVEERVAEAALVDQHDVEAGALRVDGAGHAGGAGADDEEIVEGGFGQLLPFRLVSLLGNWRAFGVTLPRHLTKDARIKELASSVVYTKLQVATCSFRGCIAEIRADRRFCFLPSILRGCEN